MEDILKMADDAEHLSSTLALRISGFEKQVTERGAAVEAEAEKFSRTTAQSDPAARQMIRRNARTNAQRQVREYRRELVKSSDNERTDRLRQLMALDTEAAKLEPLYESPAQILSRAGLGSTERTQYTEQLRHAGPRELSNHANWAIAKGDKILAAAVLSRLDAMPTKSRPMGTREFAEKLVGKEFEEKSAALRRVRVAVQRAVNVNRDFERGRVDANAKIQMGLAVRG